LKFTLLTLISWLSVFLFGFTVIPFVLKRLGFRVWNWILLIIPFIITVFVSVFFVKLSFYHIFGILLIFLIAFFLVVRGIGS